MTQAARVERLFNRDIALILIAQVAFGFGWSLYLLMPKFQAVVLGAGPDMIGMTSAIGGIAGLLMVPFAATGIDRLGRKLFFRIGCALVFAMSVGYTYVTHVGMLMFALQGMMAAAFVLAFNATAALVADWVPPARIGQAIGWLGAANVCMNAVATAIAEPLADRYGWNIVFRMGMVSALIALGLSLFLRDSPHRMFSDPPMGTLRKRVSFEAMARPLIVAAVCGAVFSAVFTFVQPFALDRGAREVRMFFIGFTASAVACRLFMGRLGDVHGYRRISLFAVVLYALAAALCAGLRPELLWAYGAVFGAAHGILYPTLNAFVLEGLPASRRGFGMALYNGAFNIGMAAGGFGWGMLAASHGYPTLFIAAAVLALLAVLPLLESRTQAQ